MKAGHCNVKRGISRRRYARGRGGFILLELILATMLFVVAVAGLAQAAKMATHDLAVLSRENDIRIGLRSFLEEVRRKPVSEMAMTQPDERLGVNFHSEVEELELKNVQGTMLKDMYRLHVGATPMDGTTENEESLDVWVYKPQTDTRQQQ